MKHQSEAYLEKADEALTHAQRILDIAVPNQAGRLGDYAAFHAAQALIFERTDRAAKTHRGVNTQFTKIVAEEGLDRELPAFLAAAYDLKSAADYETGAAGVVTVAQAAEAIAVAARFVASVKVLLEASPPRKAP